MATKQWQVQRAAGQCTVTGRVFDPGQEFYTVLFEEGESFRRMDYSLEAWTGAPQGSFCHFKTRTAVKEKKKQLLVGNHALTTFFLRLTDEKELIRVQFRFVLALLLMRKRVLRYDGTRIEGTDEVWDMTLVSEQSKHRVVNPKLTDAEVENVSRELTAILHGDMHAIMEACDQDDAPDTDEVSPTVTESEPDEEPQPA